MPRTGLAGAGHTHVVNPSPLGIVLAAGQGRRFGGPKALIALPDGRTLVERAVGALEAAGVSDVVVVAGEQAAQIADVLVGRTVQVLVNAGPERGLASSLSLALDHALAVDAPAVAILLADQPGIGPDAVARVLAAWHGGALAATGQVLGVAGHPVVLDRSVIAPLLPTLTGDRGAGPFLAAHPELVIRVDTSDVARLDDIDSPDDLRRLFEAEA